MLTYNVFRGRIVIPQRTMRSRVQKSIPSWIRPYKRAGGLRSLMFSMHNSHGSGAMRPAAPLHLNVRVDAHAGAC